MHGGDQVAAVLKKQNVRWVFTLCGGHISPVLTGCNKIGIKIIDTRHESTAVFAADAVSRLSGTIGVATVTAGPGLTNCITPIKNAQMAQSPILIIGGATATVLKNRGSLQDIDHLNLVKSITKGCFSIRRVKTISKTIQRAISLSISGVPGPVYVEIPVDVLFPEEVVRNWYGLKSNNKSIPWWMSLYLKWNVNYLFNENKTGLQQKQINKPAKPSPTKKINKILGLIEKAKKPVLLIGSPIMLDVDKIPAVADSIKKLGVPTYVSGSARSLLSKTDLPIFRYSRKNALKKADLVILFGVPCDFRLDYGRQINYKAKKIAINESLEDLFLNIRPNLYIQNSPATAIIDLAKKKIKNNWISWLHLIQKTDEKKKKNIFLKANEKTKNINPIKLFTVLDKHISDDDIIIADGGDFVATASYILRPRSYTGWLDPGGFGTLGVGAGFSLAAKLCHPKSTIWAIFGDGSFGYSLIEFDTFMRHKVPVIGIIGNDAGWTQIARDQVDILGDPVGTNLRYTNYHLAIKELGGFGISVKKEEEINPALVKAKQASLNGSSTVINVIIDKTDFRKGSISI